jgi:hypothetical protein
MTASSSGGEKHRLSCQHSTPTSPTTPERSDNQSERSLEDPLESVGDGKEHRDLSKPVEYNDASLASGA